MKASLITQAHFSSTLLYLISVLLQKTVHTPISVSLLTTYALTLCNQVLLFTLSPSAPRSCDCPWGKSNGLFPMLILTSVSDTTDHFLTSLFPCTSKHSILKVLLFFWQFLLSPLLASAPKWRCFPCSILCPPIPHSNGNFSAGISNSDLLLNSLLFQLPNQYLDLG